MKKEADKLGIPLKELLVMKTRTPRTPSNKGKKNPVAKTMTAAKGSYATKKKKV
jgi:hypothetical protein